MSWEGGGAAKKVMSLTQMNFVPILHKQQETHIKETLCTSEIAILPDSFKPHLLGKMVCRYICAYA